MINDLQCLLMCYMVIKRIQPLQSLQIRNTIEMNDRFPVSFHNGQFVLQTTDDIGHLLKLREIFQFAKHIDCLLHHFKFIVTKRHVSNAIIFVCISIILVVIHLNGCIIAQLIGTHHLNIILNRTNRNTFGQSFHFVECLTTSVHQIL